MDLWTLFSIARDHSPQKKAIEFVDTEAGRFDRHSIHDAAVAFTYAQLFDEAERWASALQRLGVEKGDRIAFYLSNRPEFVIAYLATLRLGAIMVPINLRYRRLELHHILNDAEPRFLIAEAAQKPVLDQLSFADFGPVERVLSVDHPETWLAPTQLDAPAVQGEDLALIMYTSGTTGRSKGAMLSHNNVLATVTGLLAAWAWEREDALLLPLPLFHTHGLVVGLHCALAAGATVHLRRSFDAEETVQMLSSGGATLFFGVPTLYVRLLDLLTGMDPRPDFSQMRLFCSGSAPLAAETHIAFEQATGHRILERYGMTESG